GRRCDGEGREVTMTGFLHEQEFSRKSFLKGGGAMVVGVSLAGTALAGKAQAAESPFASNGSPDLGQVDTFIVIHADNTATIKTGRVELGPGGTPRMMGVAGRQA